MRPIGMRFAWLVSAAAVVFSACGIPYDSAGTLGFVRGGTLRVGVVANVPWVVDRGAAVDGIEGRLASSLATSIGARVEWVRMPEFELINALKRREVQLVIGGFEAGLPWAQEVALTRPYLESPDGKAHVLAAPPGENAWLMFIDRHIEALKPAIPSMLRERS